MGSPLHPHAIGQSTGPLALQRRLNSGRAAPICSPMSSTRRFEDVLAAAQHGSEWAWQQILGELGPAITAYARSQGISDANDLLGQVLEGMVRGIATFKGNETSFRSWAFTIVHSRIIDARRRSGRRPQISDHEVPDFADPDADTHDASPTLSRESALAMLEALPTKQREVVALRVIAGLSVQETAQVLKKRPGAVRVAMHRALQTLEKEDVEKQNLGEV
jgi:RNA polymerase sigma-70 factor (ECF subfamily)